MLFRSVKKKWANKTPIKNRTLFPNIPFSAVELPYANVKPLIRMLVLDPVFKEALAFVSCTDPYTSGLFLFPLRVMKMNVKHSFHVPAPPAPCSDLGIFTAEESRTVGADLISSLSFTCRCQRQAGQATSHQAHGTVPGTVSVTPTSGDRCGSLNFTYRSVGEMMGFLRSSL